MNGLTDSGTKDVYELLNILDAKSTGLLTFNTIFLTSISVWLGYVPLNFMHLILDVVFLALLVSCMLSLSVIWLRWSRQGESGAALELVRDSRTRRYHVAWGISATSVVAVVIVAAVHTLGTALTASGHCTGTCASFYSEQVFGNLDVQRRGRDK